MWSLALRVGSRGGSDVAVAAALLLPLLLLLLQASGASGTSGPSASGAAEGPPAGDWTECPGSCRCKWVSGKKVAECAGAGLSAVPNTLSPEIQVLDLSSNLIPVLTRDAFRAVGLVNLHKVFLRSCSIRDVDRDSFRDLKIMIELDLSQNRVSSLHPDTFRGNDRLRVLLLNDNPLTQLKPFQFPQLPHLRTLEMQRCRISQVAKQALAHLTTLESLLLNGNLLTNMRREVLQPLTKLKSLSLENNPWRCDCRLKAFRDWILEKNLFSVPTACAEPERLAGRTWDHTSSDDFACKPEIQVPEEIVYGFAGGNATLSCLVMANPLPEIKWVQGGRVLANMSRIPFGQQLYIIREEVEDADGSGSGAGVERWTNLTIARADEQDAGEYTCVARNAGGVAERNVTLLFPEAPLLLPENSGARGTPWGILAGAVVGAAVLLAVLALVLCCFCARRRRNMMQRMDRGAGPPVGKKGKKKKKGELLTAEECARKLNGSLGISYSDQAKQLLDVNPLKKPPRVVVHGNYEGVPQTDVEMCELSRQQHMSSVLLPNNNSSPSPASAVTSCTDLPPSSFPMLLPDCDGGPPSYVASERFDDVAAGEPLSAGSSMLPHQHQQHQQQHPHQLQPQNHLPQQQQQPHPHQTQGNPVLVSPSPVPSSMIGGGGAPSSRRSSSDAPLLQHDLSSASAQYPDLLDIPARGKQSSPSSTASTAPDTSRMAPMSSPAPQQLNPAHLEPLPAAYFPYVEQQSLLMAPRPGYVTLPRKPRGSPSWAPSPPPGPPSLPTATSPTPNPSAEPVVKLEPMYDNLGPRTTADGSSWLALDDILAGNIATGGRMAAFVLPPYRSPVEPRCENSATMPRAKPPVPPKPKKQGVVGPGPPLQLASMPGLAAVPEGHDFFQDEGEDGTEV